VSPIKVPGVCTFTQFRPLKLAEEMLMYTFQSLVFRCTPHAYEPTDSYA